jgi:homoserine O-acetyltransferase
MALTVDTPRDLPSATYFDPCILNRVQNARAAVAEAPEDESTPSASDSTNPALSFPCLDAREAQTAALSTRSLSSGPEPSYTTGKHLNFHSREPLLLDWGGALPQFNIAYETWGRLNEDKSNVILLHTGLSASSHAHSTETNTKPGWWEKFIGPGAPRPEQVLYHMYKRHRRLLWEYGT